MNGKQKEFLAKSGINLTDGLIYFSENERLYEKYLFRFLEEPTFPELFKAINEDELALQYAQIEKQQNDFGKKKPTKVIKVGRNDPCPCGSGKKFKQCCLH